jgi:predicted TIM-barrel fold metal-dependent hydrolase
MLSQISGTKYHVWESLYTYPADPRTSSSRPYEDEFDLMHVLGWPFESSLAASRLVLSGIISSHENLNVIIHHTGAMIPFFAGRIIESFRQKLSLLKPDQKFDAAAQGTNLLPIDHFRRFYFDTAIGGNKYAVDCAYRIFGSKRIIFGTDYPFGPDQGRERIATYPDMIRELGLTETEKSEIFFDTASRLLGIESS